MTTNPALVALRFLVGSWDMELSGASFLASPNTRVHGSVTFEWVAEGAALLMRMTAGDPGQAPAPGPQGATWIIGRDDREPCYLALYADGRGVSRVYRMSLVDGTWRIWRDTPEFSQRFDAQVSADRTEINGSWQRSADGGMTWEHDFKVRYRRLGVSAS